MHGGPREGAGRPQGARNHRSRQLAEQVAASGLSPLDFLLKVVRGERIPLLTDGNESFHVPTFAERLEAAKAAAPYCAPKLAAIAHSGPGGRPIDFVSQEQKDAAVRAALRADH